MAHFAEIDENNIVIRVLVVPNEEEHRGQEYLADELGLGGTWIQTSYNDNIRKRYAGAGYIYDPVNDAFLLPKPYDSWILNDDLEWEAPIPKPDDDLENGILHLWNEDTLSWKQIVIKDGNS